MKRTDPYIRVQGRRGEMRNSTGNGCKQPPMLKPFGTRASDCTSAERVVEKAK